MIHIYDWKFPMYKETTKAMWKIRDTGETQIRTDRFLSSAFVAFPLKRKRFFPRPTLPRD